MWFSYVMGVSWGGVGCFKDLVSEFVFNGNIVLFEDEMIWIVQVKCEFDLLLVVICLLLLMICISFGCWV